MADFPEKSKWEYTFSCLRCRRNRTSYLHAGLLFSAGLKLFWPVITGQHRRSFSVTPSFTQKLVGLQRHIWQPAASGEHSKCQSGALRWVLTASRAFPCLCLEDYSSGRWALKKIGVVVSVQMKASSGVWAEPAMQSPALTVGWWCPSGLVHGNS